MMCHKSWFSGILAVALITSTATAADTVASGKVKSINADNKTFVLTDSAEKDHTFTLGDNLVVNRAGKESTSNLKTGDAISVCYDPGILTWTAHYILVQEGASKSCELIHGSIKGYDADKKELTVTDGSKKDSTYAMSKAQVRVNMKDAKIESAKIGDHALLIVETIKGTPTLQSVMIQRAK